MAGLEKPPFGCGQCDELAGCRFARTAESGPDGGGRAELRGRDLVLPATAVFLLPLVAAMGGAYLTGRWWAGASFASGGWWQAGGAMGGLILGAGLARLLLMRLRGRRTSTGGATGHDR